MLFIFTNNFINPFKMEIYLSQIGLIFDMVGVFFLFIYGLPSKIESITDTYDFEDEKENKKEILKSNRHIENMANIGLGLIIIGFIVQFFSYWYPKSFHLFIF